MNKTQKKILMLAIFSLSLTGLFVPWKIENNNRVIDMGYWWITNPPIRTNSYGYAFSSTINTQTLLIQWAVIIIISIGLIFYFKDGNK